MRRGKEDKNYPFLPSHPLVYFRRKFSNPSLVRCGVVRPGGNSAFPLPRSFLVNTSALGNCENREESSLLQSTLTNSVECLRGQDVVCYCQIHGVIFAGKRSTVHGHGLFVAVPLSLSGCFLGWRWILEFCFQCWWIIFKKHVREQASYKTEDPLYMCFCEYLLCSKGDLLFKSGGCPV